MYLGIISIDVFFFFKVFCWIVLLLASACDFVRVKAQTAGQSPLLIQRRLLLSVVINARVIYYYAWSRKSGQS